MTHVVSAGSTVELTVTATGELPLTFEWYREFFPFAYTNATLQEHTCTLVLTNVMPEMATFFRVQVINDYGNDWSGIAYLAVTTPAMEDDGFSLTIQATTNTTWRVDFATDSWPQANWSTLTNLSIPSFPPYVKFVDTDATNRNRFYRVIPTVF